ncbi:hypothetical protein ACQP2C_18700 [Micromonospora zamorensis]
MPTRDDPMGEAARQALGAEVGHKTPSNAINQQASPMATDEGL